ncbi:hypothetical protein LCGC14_2675670 [marine sediment metagenome]|uniref:Glycosyltransferase 2-like domain-containing protein n=1 Tax=marine sediment metagenome TaxID=412755 RepID=A0A0F8ZMT3_9ZZZZ
MVDTLDFLILSRNRGTILRRCLYSIMATCDVPYRITVAFDDDPDWRAIENIAPQAARILLRPRHYYVRGVNALFQHARTCTPEMDFFVLLNDDVEFVVSGWAEGIIDFLKKQAPDGEGIVVLDEPEKCANYLSRVSFFDKHFDGLLAEPCYTMYYSDSELMERTKALGRYSHGTLSLKTDSGEVHAKVLRHHEVDDYTRTEVNRWHKSDRETFERRMRSE